jgi:TRAP-type C4-dicarboxylate transport system substrate-binding protein
MKKVIYGLLAVILLVGLVAGCTAKPAGPITWDYVSFTPLTNDIEFGVIKQNFIDPVNERSNGRLTINVRGGPEVIPSYDLGSAVQTGTIDIASIPIGFFDSLIPGADSMRLSPFTAAEEREKGIYDYVQEAVFEPNGFYNLGRPTTTDDFFYHSMTKRIEKPEDFIGIKISGSPSLFAWAEALGMTPMLVQLPEYYSALERGVVDGITSSHCVWMDQGLPEIANYIIDHPVYTATPVMVVNLDSWNQLPKDLQDLVTEIFIEHENAANDYYRAATAEEMRIAKEAGVEYVTFPPDMAQWYTELAYSAAWEDDAKRYPGDVVPTLKEMYGQ